MTETQIKSKLELIIAHADATASLARELIKNLQHAAKPTKTPKGLSPEQVASLVAGRRRTRNRAINQARK